MNKFADIAFRATFAAIILLQPIFFVLGHMYL